MSKKKPKNTSDSTFELLDLSIGMEDFKSSKPSPPGKKKKAKKKGTRSPGPSAAPAPFINNLFSLEDSSSSRFNTLSQSDDSGFGSGQANLEDDDGSPHHTDIENEGTDVQGEFAMDLFIDASNPFNKVVHTSLQSTIEKQKKDHAEVTQLRAEQLRDQGFGFLCNKL